MTQTPVYHLPDLKFDYYTIVPHRSEPQVLLLLGEDGGWSLPHFVPIEHHFGVVSHINQVMQSHLGIEVTVLRCIYNQVNRDRKQVCRVYALENHSPKWIPPASGRWVAAAELNQLRLTIPEHRSLLSAWFAEAERTKKLKKIKLKIGREKDKKLSLSPSENCILTSEVPWAIAGWFDSAASWIRERLDRLEIRAIAPIEQIKSWALATVLRVPTTAGNIYFKATPALFEREPLLTQNLTQYYPENLPKVLAIDSARSWILMQDMGGKTLRQVSEITHWEAALRRFANIQIDTVQHQNSLIERGWLDLRLPRIFEQFNLLFEGDLYNSEIRELLAFVPQLAAAFKALNDLRVPDTLVHGDLSPQNIYVTETNYLYFDWSDSCISHPFFDLVRFLYEIDMELPNFTDASEVSVSQTRSRLRNAYLEPWTIYEPMERLIGVFELLSETLISLYQAIIQCGLTLDREAIARWDLQAAVPFYIKRLLIQVATYLQVSLRGGAIGDRSGSIPNL